jgi:hypothetical protein
VLSDFTTESWGNWFWHFPCKALPAGIDFSD